MAECAFCNIINKQADAYVIHESDYVVAFLDIDPIHEGHVLIVPKIHEDSIHKIPIPVLTEIMELAQRSVAALKEIYDMDGYSIMQNGGQFCDFGHFHVHVFPRYQNDGFGWKYPQGEFACSDEVAGKIKRVLKMKNSDLQGEL